MIATCSGQRAKPATDNDDENTSSSDEDSGDGEEDKSTDRGGHDDSSSHSSVHTPRSLRRFPDNSINMWSI